LYCAYSSKITQKVSSLLHLLQEMPAEWIFRNSTQLKGLCATESGAQIFSKSQLATAFATRNACGVNFQNFYPFEGTLCVKEQSADVLKSYLQEIPVQLTFEKFQPIPPILTGKPRLEILKGQPTAKWSM